MWVKNNQSNAVYYIEDDKMISYMSNSDRFVVNYRPEIVDSKKKEIEVKHEQLKNDTKSESNNIVKKSQYVCEVCDREFKNASGLSAHNRTKHGGDTK